MTDAPDRKRGPYRERFRAATTAAEPERIRAEHHERMQQRAVERGVTLPEEPPMRRGGRGDGQSDGQGAGAGKMHKGSGN